MNNQSFTDCFEQLMFWYGACVRAFLRQAQDVVLAQELSKLGVQILICSFAMGKWRKDETID